MNSSRIPLTLAALALTAACSTTTPTTSGTTGSTPDTGDARHRTTTTVPTPEPGTTVAPGGPILPRADLTPGKAADPSSPNGTKDKLCAPGFTTKSVRPPVSVTDRIKVERMAAYGIPTNETASFELDHLTPLSSGGDPLSDLNLWPEPWERDRSHPEGIALPGTGAQSKDRIEVGLARAICANKIPLADAQHRIATDWPHALDGFATASDATSASEEEG